LRKFPESHDHQTSALQERRDDHATTCRHGARATRSNGNLKSRSGTHAGGSHSLSSENEELHRTNEELRRDRRDVDEPETASPLREFTTPFSQAILGTAIPNTFTGPKVTFTRKEDPEAHLAAFHTQMMLVGGSDAVKCKFFMSTLTGMALDWFVSLPEGHVTSFAQLS